MTPLLPITYFGNIEYFSFFAKHQTVGIDITETYQKQTFRNRSQIYGANGMLNISVPVKRPYGKLTKVNQVEISYLENWQKNHWKSIESAYRRTPFYEFYTDAIKDILFKKHQYLIDLNLAFTNHLIEKLGIDCKIKLITSSPNFEFNDLRSILSSKHKSDFKCKPYIQTFSDRNPFINNLSILDLLFNEGPNSICIIEESL
jgi:hypothetical protein